SSMGRHPRRTPFYGVLMLLTAMLGGFAVAQLPYPPLRVLGYFALVAIGLVGFVMTFRDYS
ncbi:hypothetical protein ACW9HQ_41435, partial [Nocardia gipuzkoensis]